jgi:hypothetical protein
MSFKKILALGWKILYNSKERRKRIIISISNVIEI